MKSLEDIAGSSVLSKEQLQRIEDILLKKGVYTPQAIRGEIDWFCTGLGMTEYYFQTTALETIASHIEAIKAAEIIASSQTEKSLKIDLYRELENEAIYLVDDFHYRALEIEKRIESKYPHCRLQSYRTLGKTMGAEHLRMYLVYNPKFKLDAKLREETDLKKIACPSFLETTTPETYQRYQDALEKSMGMEAPLIEVSHKEETGEIRLMVVTNRDSSRRFFTNVSDVINSHGLVSIRKYIEQFANGKTVYAFYLVDIHDPELIRTLVEDISLVYVIPESPLADLFREGKLNAQETVFGVAAWSFSHQFLTGYTEEYLKLAKELNQNPELMGILRNLKTRLAKDTYDEARVWESLVENPKFLKKMFRIFNKKFNPFVENHDVDEDIRAVSDEIKYELATDVDRNIFSFILVFIRAIRRTNFFKKEKSAIAFMYAPIFLHPVDYPENPFGIFHIIGIEMRGFHIRFRDIARGGIRIVRSVNYENYLNNSDFIFDENYNLASTQQRKNKDIPEGGSKGAILLRWGYLDKSETAFKKYVNGLLDLMMPDEGIVDGYGQEVLLFLGPDEGTADLMEWASTWARRRNYPYWKSFSTGKPLHMGGIPHDLYGMTTNSIHQYVLCLLEKFQLGEKDISKVITGGPDGDLGSNEILISETPILAIIDGSGVLYDPRGIDREELVRLARARKPVEHFRRDAISSDGFLVILKDQNTTLPDGQKVVNGLEFRNNFHRNPKFKADLFVPCGGRPASINIGNWTDFIDEKGTPRFRFIVEGANLFITQEARLRLEEKGVIIYKDASANKGGVTSSSLEVFASLALSDREYEELMIVEKGRVPRFRQDYIKEIIEIIRHNARLEFEIVWEENEKKKIPRPILSDLISEKINKIKDAIYSSGLFTNEELFRKVIECCCPMVLVSKVGFENILERVPAAYLKAIFASRLASRYVYKYGLDANELDFYDFIKDYR